MLENRALKFPCIIFIVIRSKVIFRFLAVIIYCSFYFNLVNKVLFPGCLERDVDGIYYLLEDLSSFVGFMRQTPGLSSNRFFMEKHFQWKDIWKELLTITHYYIKYNTSLVLIV